MNQTAIVFGATGLVGKELVFELLENARYLNVKAVVRRALPLSHPKLEQIIVNDFAKLDDYWKQLAADVFFCCIGTTIKAAGSQEAFKKVDIDIPVKIATIAEALKVPHLIVISSVGANANSPNFYLRTKGEMEQQVQAAYHGNLKFVRPSFLIGNRGEFRIGEKIAKALNTILRIFMIGSLAKYKGIYSWDVAWAMIQVIEFPKEKIFIESDELQKIAGKNKRAKPPLIPGI
jgi:uncharacterized protein YbjT (DUF2867 family)